MFKRFTFRIKLFIAAGAVFAAGCAPRPAVEAPSVPPVAEEKAPPAAFGSISPADAVPDWAKDAVFYQIFPERFRNGDPSNDPTAESLELGVQVPPSWRISPWTGDWYAQEDWEKEMGDFYEGGGVFNRRYGGDLQGVVEELNYLKELGINVIYFNPVFYARSMHKYDGNTFHHIDPYFGPDPDGDLALMATETSSPSTWHVTAADSLFFSLVRQAHARGIRVIIDGVFNHTGRNFFAFENLRREQERSPYKDWYIVQSYDDPATPENEFRYNGWWGYDTLPELAETDNDLHPGPKAYIFDATARWMDPNGDGDLSDGIDGWRLDVANEVPLGFWNNWNRHIRSINPEAYTVTEIWENAADFLQRGGFSATMNYHGFAFPVKGFLVDGALEPAAFAEQIEERREEYPVVRQYAQQNLMDSHDTDRLASMIVNAGRQPYENADRFDYDVTSRVSPRNSPLVEVRAPNARERAVQKMVALFQMAYVGPPMIYYGTEAGMWGNDDPDDRMPMVWPDLQYADQASDPMGRPRVPDPVAFDRGLFNYYKDVIALRHARPELRRGSYETLAADNERDILAVARTLGSEVTIVVLNRSEEAHSIRIPLPESLRKTYRISMTTNGTSYRLQQDAEALLLEIPGLTGLVLQPE